MKLRLALLTALTASGCYVRTAGPANPSQPSATAVAQADHATCDTDRDDDEADVAQSEEVDDDPADTDDGDHVADDDHDDDDD